MPDLPSRHRTSQPKPRPSRWDVGKAERKVKGRPWQRLRASVLTRDRQLCQPCMAIGRYTPAAEVDHIIPLSAGGTDHIDNLQSICVPCHKAKTACEGGRGTTHPEWLPKPACPVVVVTGPPGAGKTTWCKAQAKPHDVVIDLDECFLEVSGTHGHDADRKYLDAAIRLRNSKLADLASKRKGTAYLIVGEPLAGRVKWWMDKLGASHMLVDPGIDACLSRVSGRRADAVMAWYGRRNYSSPLQLQPSHK